MIRLTFQPPNAGYGNAFILRFEGGLEVLFIRGDVNADRVVNLSDLSYLANFLFSGGHPPHAQKRLMSTTMDMLI